MVQVKHILQWIDSLAPFRFAESWDNCGLQVGDPDAPVGRILVALDPGSGVIEEAERLGCQCIVTHHPLLFQPIKTIRTDSWPGNIIARALNAKINLIAAHTNLDAAREGTNAQLIQLLELTGTEALELQTSPSGDDRYAGIGMTGDLPAPLSLGSLAARLRKALPETGIRVVGNPEKMLRRAAVCSGSGASLIGRVLSAGADVFITGDIKYHDAKLAEETGLALIDIGHFASEKLILAPLAGHLRACAHSGKDELEIFVAKSERDPFRTLSE